MAQEKELLDAGEEVVQRFNVEIARLTPTGQWATTIPPIYLTLTDRRIIMIPQTRKRYPPATITGKSIKHVQPLKAHRHGTIIILKNNFRISLFINGNANDVFMELIRELAGLPPARPYDIPISIEKLKKLVDFFEHLS